MEEKFKSAVILIIALFLTVWALNSSFALISAASTVSVLVGVFLLATTVFSIILFLPLYKDHVQKILFLLPLCLLLGMTSGCGLKTIPPGYVGIVVNQYGSQKGVEDFPAQVGRIIYNPLTSTIYMFPTFQQNVVWTKSLNEGSASDESITFNGAENAAVNVDVAIGYSLAPEKVPHLFMHYKQDIDHITHTYVRNEVRDLLTRLGPNYKTMDILGAKKSELLDQVKRGLIERLGDKGFIFDMVSFVGKPRVDPTIEAAINRSIEATQQAQAAENKVRQVKAEADQAVAQADGEARAILTKAKAQADANKILASSVTPDLTAYMYAQSWDGKMPQVMSNATPFFQLTPGGK